MRLRTATIIRSAAVGFAIGFVVACYTIATTKPLPPVGIMVSQFVGSIAGATIALAAFGYLRSRKLPPDAMVPPLSAARKIVLAICAAIIVAAIGAIAYLLTVSRPMTSFAAGPSAIAPAAQPRANPN